MDKIKIIVSYCLPALLALSLLLYGYYQRTQEVSEVITQQKEKLVKGVLSAKSLGQTVNSLERLTIFIEANKADFNTMSEKSNPLSKPNIEKTLRDIWLSNSLYIVTMVLLPYILFGSRLAFSNRIKLSSKERLDTTKQNWWMKFIVACVMGLGWVYVLNPTGRGESTLAQFLIKVDFSSHDSIPLFIQSVGMVPVIAGFLGWYLYLLTYFFSKLVHHDVVSARVYSLLFKKLLFTYGIAMIIPSVQVASDMPGVSIGQNQSVLMFFIGYFPLAAFSMLKERGLKLSGDLKTDTGYLTELPGISRWQVLRLEEEGIDNMAALAYAEHQRLREGLMSMATMLNLWVDIAQLYVIVGHESYHKLVPQCKSASGFIHKVKGENSAFITFVSEQEIGDANEIARLLERTFNGKLVEFS